MTKRELEQKRLQSAARIQRGESVERIALSWGEVEWRASTLTLTGTSLEGVPFTIHDVERDALYDWLSGRLTHAIFPRMSKEDRLLLNTGHCTG